MNDDFTFQLNFKKIYIEFRDENNRPLPEVLYNFGTVYVKAVTDIISKMTVGNPDAKLNTKFVLDISEMMDKAIVDMLGYTHYKTSFRYAFSNDMWNSVLIIFTIHDTSEEK